MSLFKLKLQTTRDYRVINNQEYYDLTIEVFLDKIYDLSFRTLNFNYVFIYQKFDDGTTEFVRVAENISDMKNIPIREQFVTSSSENKLFRDNKYHNTYSTFEDLIAAQEYIKYQIYKFIKDTNNIYYYNYENSEEEIYPDKRDYDIDLYIQEILNYKYQLKELDLQEEMYNKFIKKYIDVIEGLINSVLNSSEELINITSEHVNTGLYNSLINNIGVLKDTIPKITAAADTINDVVQVIKQTGEITKNIVSNGTARVIQTVEDNPSLPTDVIDSLNTSITVLKNGLIKIRDIDVNVNIVDIQQTDIDTVQTQLKIILPQLHNLKLDINKILDVRDTVVNLQEILNKMKIDLQNIKHTMQLTIDKIKEKREDLLASLQQAQASLLKLRPDIDIEHPENIWRVEVYANIEE